MCVFLLQCLCFYALTSCVETRVQYSCLFHIHESLILKWERDCTLYHWSDPVTYQAPACYDRVTKQTVTLLFVHFKLNFKHLWILKNTRQFQTLSCVSCSPKLMMMINIIYIDLAKPKIEAPQSILLLMRIIRHVGKVESAFGQSGPSGRSLSRFL